METNQSQAPFKRNKKKRKNARFLHNAKGFAKQGIYGRGTHIDDDQYNYFINILDAMKNGFEDIEEKVTMANNVFEQTKDKEVYLASNQIVCKVLETLVGFVDATQLEAYFQAFADSFRPICSDRFASHVLQKMVEIAFLRSVQKDQLKKAKSEENEEEEEKDDEPPSSKKPKLNKDVLSEERYNLDTEFLEEHKQNCANFVLRVGKFMLNNLEDFVWDHCANHIMRTCILCLSGIHVVKVAFEKGGADMAKNRKVYVVSEEFKEIAKEFAQRLEMWPQFCDFPYQEHSSALMGVLCIALKVIDKNMLKHFGKKILMEALLKAEETGDEEKEKKIEISDEETEEEPKEGIKGNKESQESSEVAQTKLPKVFQYQCSVILLETLLTVAGPKLLTQLYAMLFANKMALLAKEPSSNFAVQRLLQNIKEKDDFENVFQELHEHTEELLKIGHTGVIAALSSACLRLQTKQGQFISALQSALHVSGDKEKMKSFLLCLIKLKPFEILQQDKTAFVHLHGSLVIQDILRFNKPIFMVNCMLETSADYVVSVFNTPNGSHICDAFLESKFIGEKSREKLIKHLEGFYVDLAITKFGSRVIESCFAAASEPQKARIVKELADKSNMLKGTPFGKLIYHKLRVETYRLSADQWKASLQQKESKVTQLFKDIIN
ncbi:nucleolar protein 9 [Stomoxys calcitrans]|uniref:nucleolar protein 9 n=1 Tax=Stomoxys calcitrans TaxID=35570 RepID=UPI0027E37237|nr:nucleolar protein 9 [Stomoxys calcitrans]